MEQKEKTGFIYVLTNESFHKANWIKIGYAEDVDKRVKDLSGTSVPLPYKVYCTYEIPRINGTKDPDKLIHSLIQLRDASVSDHLKCQASIRVNSKRTVLSLVI